MMTSMMGLQQCSSGQACSGEPDINFHDFDGFDDDEHDLHDERDDFDKAYYFHEDEDNFDDDEV